jgi:hypothetical protein
MMNICFDFETLDTTVTSIIISLGAVAFNSDITDEFYQTLDVKEQVGKRTVSTSTIEWWLTRPTLFADTIKSGEPMKRVATNFILWCRKHINKDSYVFIKGPGFDLPIMSYFLKDYGYKEPWEYWQCLDVRTLQKVNNWNMESSKFKDKFPPGDLHNALIDSKIQAYSVIELLNKG